MKEMAVLPQKEKPMSGSEDTEKPRKFTIYDGSARRGGMKGALEDGDRQDLYSLLQTRYLYQKLVERYFRSLELDSLGL